MTSVSDLITQIKTNLDATPLSERGEKLCAVTETLVGGKIPLTDEQISQYDLLLLYFSEQIELASLAKISFLLSKMDGGPPKTICALARHEDILIAGPILAGSPMLDDPLLSEIVHSRPQTHLRAVCERSSLSVLVTTEILEFGDEGTTRHLAQNPGARFSDEGFATLVERSKRDDELAARVGARADIPSQHLDLLLRAASSDVRRRLMRANPKVANLVREAVADATGEVAATASQAAADLTMRLEKVSQMYRDGELDSAALVGFAERRERQETLIAMSLMCRVEPSVAMRAIKQTGIDTALMMAKVCELSWQEAKTILQLLKPGISALDVDRAMSQFARLKPETARSILHLRTQPVSGTRPRAGQDPGVGPGGSSTH